MYLTFKAFALKNKIKIKMKILSKLVDNFNDLK